MIENRAHRTRDAASGIGQNDLGSIIAHVHLYIFPYSII
jgi:hypothetical protein